MTESNADFLAAFGVNPDDAGPAQDNSGVDANPDAQNGQQNNVEVTVDPPTENADTQNQQTDQNNANADNINNAQNNNTTQQVDNRMNQAFAQMRSENTSYKKLVNNIAGVLGIDTNTPQDQILNVVQDAVLKAQAKQQNMDPAVLQKITQLEQFKEQTERQSFTNRALMGFQTVKNQFNLSDADIDAFANQLMQDGVNPFTSEVNLMAEYKVRNFDALIKAAEQRGALKEAQRQQNVAAHSTSPDKTTGASGASDPDKIKSVSELSDWLEKNSK